MNIMAFEERIKQRAYELFLERGCEHGNDQMDWFLAEQELTAEKNGKKTTAKFSRRSIHK